MNLKLSYPRGRARHSTALGVALACSLGCFAAHAQTDQGEKRTPPPQESPSEPSTPPVEAQPDLAPAAAPLPSAPEPSASSSTWPRVFFLGLAGVGLIGTVVVISSAIAVADARSDADEAWPSVITKGCQGGSASCTAFKQAIRSSGIAAGVNETAFVISMTVVSILVGGGVLDSVYNHVSAPNGAVASKSATIQVKVAPTPSGIVIQGTF